MRTIHPVSEGTIWYLRGWLFLAFAVALVVLVVLTVVLDHDWHGRLMLWSVLACAVGAVSTSVGTLAVTGLPGVDGAVRRGQRRDSVVRAAVWLAAGVVLGWLAALTGWTWLVVVLAVYVAANAAGFLGMYVVRRRKALAVR